MVRNAFLNTLTTRTLFPCTRSPSKWPWYSFESFAAWCSSICSIHYYFGNAFTATCWPLLDSVVICRSLRSDHRISIVAL